MQRHKFIILIQWPSKIGRFFCANYYFKKNLKKILISGNKVEK
jgi:hypothetical protein